jgi:hypothetical protein
MAQPEHYSQTATFSQQNSELLSGIYAREEAPLATHQTGFSKAMSDFEQAVLALNQDSPDNTSSNIIMLLQVFKRPIQDALDPVRAGVGKYSRSKNPSLFELAEKIDKVFMALDAGTPLTEDQLNTLKNLNQNEINELASNMKRSMPQRAKQAGKNALQVVWGGIQCILRALLYVIQAIVLVINALARFIGGIAKLAVNAIHNILTLNPKKLFGEGWRDLKDIFANTAKGMKEDAATMGKHGLLKLGAALTSTGEALSRVFYDEPKAHLEQGLAKAKAVPDTFVANAVNMGRTFMPGKSNVVISGKKQLQYGDPSKNITMASYEVAALAGNPALDIPSPLNFRVSPSKEGRDKLIFTASSVIEIINQNLEKLKKNPKELEFLKDAMKDDLHQQKELEALQHQYHGNLANPLSRQNLPNTVYSRIQELNEKLYSPERIEQRKLFAIYIASEIPEVKAELNNRPDTHLFHT